MNEMKTIDPF